jgi:hypothetical protein
MLLRRSGTGQSGGTFSAEAVSLVWERGQVVPGYDSRLYRKDACGAWITRSEYGTSGTYGWEIDHIKPVAHGGGDQLANLQPLQWENNRHKGDTWPSWTCKVTAT